jgi:hypothetical protein
MVDDEKLLLKCLKKQTYAALKQGIDAPILAKAEYAAVAFVVSGTAEMKKFYFN